MIRKASAGIALAVTAVLLTATSAWATTGTTFAPATEGKGIFDANWPTLLTMVKDFAPYAIGGALVLLAIRKVVRALSGGRAVKV